jgi:hypothetical protein
LQLISENAIPKTLHTLKAENSWYMELDGRVDFLQVSQICKASNFRWKASSKAWIASYGSASSKKKKGYSISTGRPPK